MRALCNVIPERLLFSSLHTHVAPGVLFIGGNVKPGSQLVGIRKPLASHLIAKQASLKSLRPVFSNLFFFSHGDPVCVYVYLHMCICIIMKVS